MLTYTMDVESRSVWLRCTPAAEEREEPYICTEAGTFYARERFQTARSSKGSYIVFYTLGGAGIVRQGGQEVLLGRGQALLMDCRDPQSYGTAPGHRHWYHMWAHVDGRGVRSLGEALGLPALRPVQLDPDLAKPPLVVLESCLGNDDGTRPVRAGLAVHELLANMALRSKTGAPAGERSGVETARAFLERSFDRPVTVEDAAAASSLSTSQLIRQFRKQLGTTPHAYLLRYRITRAKELLAETAMPVGEVSRRTGFASESNFSYRFSRIVGQSPSAYRASAPGKV